MISTLHNSGRNYLSILTLKLKIFTLAIKQIDVTIIDADAYYAVYRLKRARVFLVFMRDLEHKAEKEASLETDPKTVISEKYYDLLNIFSKKNLDTLFSHRKYNHKIIFEEKQKHGHVPIHKILPQELDVIKHYLDLHLIKMFI